MCWFYRYFKVYNRMRAMKRADLSKDGDKLPPERELAEIYNAQRPTIRSALKMLVLEGVIEARERSGYFIKPSKIEENLRKILSLSQQIQGTGKKVSSELISFEKIELDKKLSIKSKASDWDENV